MSGIYCKFVVVVTKDFIFILLLFPTLLLGQTEYNIQRDSLFLIARNSDKLDTVRADAYIKLSELYYVHNLDSMAIVCEEGVQLLSTKSKVAPEIRKKRITQKAELINNMGVAHYRKGLLNDAVEVWYKSLELEEELGDKKGQANVLNNIANIQLDLGRIKRAEVSFLAILKIQNEINDSAGIARSYNVLGYIERTNGNDSLALDWYQKALEIRLILKTKIGIASSRNNIGFIHKKKGNYHQALIEYNEALRIYNLLNDDRGKIAVHTNLANCYYELGDYKKAKKHADIGLPYAEKFQILDDLLYLNEILYKINTATGNYKQALDYHQTYITIRDTLDSEKNYKALVNQEVEYDYQKKEKIKEMDRAREKEVEALKHESELLLAEEKSLRLKLIVSIVSFGLLAVILLLYFISKQLRITKQQKVTIEMQNKEIEMKALRSQMNPHFLFNSLNSIKHFIVKNDTESAANYLTKFSKLIRLVLENSSHNLISLQDELDCLRHYLELECLRFNGKFDFEIKGDVDAYSIELPPLILQPFIENAIWHGILNKEDGKGFIEINLLEVNSAIHIEISDNGVGRKKANEIVKATNIRKKSIGLTLTHNRLKMLNKVIGIESSVEFIDLYSDENNAIGTKVIIIIPYHE